MADNNKLYTNQTKSKP